MKKSKSSKTQTKRTINNEVLNGGVVKQILRIGISEAIRYLIHNYFTS